MFPCHAHVKWIALSVVLLVVCLGGCMSITIQDSLIINSGVAQDKPIRAGVSTTGEAIGEALKAAGYGNPIDVEAIKSVIEEVRKIKAKKVSPLSRIHPFDWRKRLGVFA
jgi:hypothetical protein